MKMYLSGDFGKDPADVNAYAASAFYAVDRVASFLQVWKKDYPADTVFLCDRYATSNIIYQMAKVPASERDAFIAWQQDFEYDKLGLPRPDAVIYLDVEPAVSQKLMETPKKTCTRATFNSFSAAAKARSMPLKNAAGK